MRILFFSSSSKSRKGKMERIKRAAEKRRAWLEVSTNNVYFIHPSLPTSLSPRHPCPFRTRTSQWPISKVDRKRAQFFFSYAASRHCRVSVHRRSGANEKKGWRGQTLKLHFHFDLVEKVDDQRCYLALPIKYSRRSVKRIFRIKSTIIVNNNIQYNFDYNGNCFL